MQKTVAMLLFNTYPGDPRVFREARSLINTKAFDVTVFAWKRPGESTHGSHKNIKIIRTNTNSPKNVKKIKDLFLFNILLFFQLLKLPRYSVYQAHDFTTLPLAFCIAKMKNAYVVYDSHEYYPALLASDEITYNSLINLIIELEKFLSNRVDLMFTAENAKANVFIRRYGVKDIQVLFNAPSITQNRIYHLASEKSALEKKWQVDDSEFTIVYPGAINPGRCLKELIEAVPDLIKVKKVKVILIGGSSTGSAYRRHLQKLIHSKGIQDNVLVFDAISNYEITEIFCICDLVYAMYPKIRDYVISIPTKVLYAARFRKRFLTSNFGEMKALANKLPFGLAVNPVADEINDALIKLVTETHVSSEVNLKEFEELWWETQSIKLKKSYYNLFR
ncbi:MAG: glycosyltransferase [Promethearchaeota archaeon]